MEKKLTGQVFCCIIVFKRFASQLETNSSRDLNSRECIRIYLHILIKVQIQYIYIILNEFLEVWVF